MPAVPVVRPPPVMASTLPPQQQQQLQLRRSSGLGPSDPVPVPGFMASCRKSDAVGMESFVPVPVACATPWVETGSGVAGRMPSPLSVPVSPSVLSPNRVREPPPLPVYRPPPSPLARWSFQPASPKAWHADPNPPHVPPPPPALAFAMGLPTPPEMAQMSHPAWSEPETFVQQISPAIAAASSVAKRALRRSSSSSSSNNHSNNNGSGEVGGSRQPPPRFDGLDSPAGLSPVATRASAASTAAAAPSSPGFWKGGAWPDARDDRSGAGWDPAVARLTAAVSVSPMGVSPSPYVHAFHAPPVPVVQGPPPAPLSSPAPAPATPLGQRHLRSPLSGTTVSHDLGITGRLQRLKATPSAAFFPTERVPTAPVGNHHHHHHPPASMPVPAPHEVSLSAAALTVGRIRRSLSLQGLQNPLK